jgi:hypothetical protein
VPTFLFLATPGDVCNLVGRARFEAGRPNPVTEWPPPPKAVASLVTRYQDPPTRVTSLSVFDSSCRDRDRPLLFSVLSLAAPHHNTNLCGLSPGPTVRCCGARLRDV